MPEVSALAAALDALAALPPDRLGSTGLRDRAADLLAAAERVQALLADTVAEAVDREHLAGREVTAWIGEQAPAVLERGTALRLARRAAAVTRLPLLCGLHRDAEVSTGYVDRAAAGLASLPPECAEAVDVLLAGAARSVAPDQVPVLIAQIRAMVSDPDPDPAEAPALPESLWLSPHGDGRWALSADLDPVHGEQLATLITRLATPTGPEDTRPPAQRRAAALIQLLRLAEQADRDADHDPSVAPPHGADAHLIVLTTPAALTHQPGAPAAVTADGTPLPPTTLDLLGCANPRTTLQHAPPTPADPGDDPQGAGQPDWQLLHNALTGLLPPPLGAPLQPLHLGRTRRLASPAQWLAIIARDRTCRDPRGCSRGPRWCQLHHLAEWDADHGPTDLDNLALLCWEHHADLHRRRRHLAPDPTRPGHYRYIEHPDWHPHSTPLAA